MTAAPQRVTDAVREDARNAVLCWLATVDADGVPNVTPKEIFAIDGDGRVLVADIASANSVRNVRAHAAVCVSFVDVFRQRGFKIRGTAQVVAASDAGFDAVSAALRQMAGAAFPIRAVIVIAAERVERIWAPSYRLLPDEGEAAKMRKAYAGYGVVPALAGGGDRSG